MSSSFLKGNSTHSRHAAPHMGNTKLHEHEQVRDVSGKSRNLKKSHNLQITVNGFSAKQIVRSTTSVNSDLLSSGGSVDFEIRNNNTLVSGGPNGSPLVVKLAVTNSGAGIIANPQPQFFFDRVELLGTDQQNVAQTVYPEQMLMWLSGMSDEEYNRYRNVINLDAATYDPTGDIAAAGTATYYIAIPTFLDTAHLFMGGLNRPLLLRFYFKAGTWLDSNSTGAATDLDVTNLELHVYGQEFSNSQAAEMRNRLKSGKYDFRFIDVDHQRFNETLVSGVEVPLLLNSIRGASAYDFITFRTASTAEDAYNFLAATYVELYDGDGDLVGIRENHSENKYVTSQVFPSSIFNSATKNIYVFPHTIDVSSSNSGAAAGLYVHDGGSEIRINTALTGAHIIDYWSFQYALATLEDGELRFTK